MKFRITNDHTRDELKLTFFLAIDDDGDLILKVEGNNGYAADLLMIDQDNGMMSLFGDISDYLGLRLDVNNKLLINN